MEKVCKDMEELIEEAKRTGDLIKDLKERKIAVTAQLDKEYEEYVCRQIIKESSEKLTKNIQDAVRAKQMIYQKLQNQREGMEKILREGQNILPV